jgi:hypothetical protein
MEMLVYFMAICYILRSFGIIFGDWYIFSRFGMLYQEKSGNPAPIEPRMPCSQFLCDNHLTSVSSRALQQVSLLRRR